MHHVYTLHHIICTHATLQTYLKLAHEFLSCFNCVHGVCGAFIGHRSMLGHRESRAFLLQYNLSNVPVCSLLLQCCCSVNILKNHQLKNRETSRAALSRIMKLICRLTAVINHLSTLERTLKWSGLVPHRPSRYIQLGRSCRLTLRGHHRR